MAALFSNLRTALGRHARSLQCRSVTRSLATQSTPAPPPRRPDVPPMGKFSEPSAWLKAIGRDADTKYSPQSWEQLWKTTGSDLKKAGVAVRDRRYILWAMEKFRHGYSISEFAHEPQPKKTIRGWGPKVQNGKRIRSRRIKY